ncbi:MAG: flagellar FliJ family protein [Planctomycetaceae bacterium]
MTDFKFKFESLLRYRKNRRDLCLQLLSQILAEDRELMKKQESLVRRRLVQLEELRALGKQGAFKIEGATARHNYISQLTGEIRLVEHQRDIVARQIELCRRAVTQAEQDVSALETLEEKQAADFRYQQQRREVRELDESCRANRLADASR